MKKALSLLISFCLACFFSNCKKDASETGVLLRIENNTHVNFKSVVSNSYEFGSINANSTSGYIKFDQIVDNPSAFMVAGNDTLICGLFYIDYIGFIKSGKYTLQIYTDESAYSGYGCSYIKE